MNENSSPQPTPRRRRSFAQSATTPLPIAIRKRKAESPIDVTKSPDTAKRDTDDAHTMWIPSLSLYESAKKLIDDGWLNDRVIDAVNNLVRKQLGTTAQTTLMSRAKSGFEACTVSRYDSTILSGKLFHTLTMCSQKKFFRTFIRQ